MQHFSGLLLVLKISFSLFISPLATISGKHNFIFPSVTAVFTSLVRWFVPEWIITISGFWWIIVVYDVVCCSAWVCFYLYLAILRNSMASYVFLYGIAIYINLSSWLFVSIFLLSGIPHFCIWWWYCSWWSNLDLCFLFHDGLSL